MKQNPFSPMLRTRRWACKHLLPLTILLLGLASQTIAQDLAWANRLGGTTGDLGRSTAVDGAGNVYTTGSFSGTVDFNPGPGTFILTSAGGNDIFVSKLDAAGNFLWARKIGGTSTDEGRALAVDGSGNVLITGIFHSTVDFDPGPGTVELTASTFRDTYVTKLDAAGEFVWAKSFGTGVDFGHSVSFDGMGNVYTVGSFRATVDFDPGPGVFELSSAGGEAVFISKLDRTGNFVWARMLGGNSGSFAYGYSVAVDGASNVHVTGYFLDNPDFDPGQGVFSLSSQGGVDIFVSKLNAAGNFVWAKRLGGNGFDVGYSVAVDGTGNVYTTGRFNSDGRFSVSDFDPGPGTFSLNSVQGNTDVFVSKLDAGGNFVWAVSLGGAGDDQGRSVAVDGAGNVYTTGYFEGTADYKPGSGTFNLTSAGSSDIFISKLDATGQFVWAKRMGGPESDEGTSVAVDGRSNVYTTGFFRNTADFDPGAGTFNLTSAGDADISISKLNGGRCGTDGQNVIICYYGTEQCVSENTAERYIRLGATRGGCNTGNARIGYEPVSSGLELTLQAYPNPTTDAVTVEVLAPTAGPAELLVLDVAGRPLQQRRQPLVEGINEVEFKLGVLPAGTYLIRVVDALNRQGVLRVTKQ